MTIRQITEDNRAAGVSLAAVTQQLQTPVQFRADRKRRRNEKAPWYHWTYPTFWSPKHRARNRPPLQAQVRAVNQSHRLSRSFDKAAMPARAFNYVLPRKPAVQASSIAKQIAVIRAHRPIVSRTFDHPSILFKNLQAFEFRTTHFKREGLPRFFKPAISKRRPYPFPW
jgi:hypothetical protein